MAGESTSQTHSTVHGTRSSTLTAFGDGWSNWTQTRKAAWKSIRTSSSISENCALIRFGLRAVTLRLIPIATLEPHHHLALGGVCAARRLPRPEPGHGL